MKLFTVRIPEIEHLPPDKRAALLKRAVESSEVLDYRQRATRKALQISMVLCLLAFSILMGFWITLIVDNLLIPGVIFGVALIGFWIVAQVFQGRGEISLIRALLRKELEEAPDK
jgi:hypothetical protein